MKTAINFPTVLRPYRCPNRKSRRRNGRDALTRGDRGHIRHRENRARVPTGGRWSLMFHGRIKVMPGNRRWLGYRGEARL